MDIQKAKVARNTRTNFSLVTAKCCGLRTVQAHASFRKLKNPAIFKHLSEWRTYFFEIARSDEPGWPGLNGNDGD
jgi:hypothetical protein